METDSFQPDPDELLKAVQKEEAQKKSGKLKIFFGMSAGVGKTYSMLEEAQALLKEGKNVVAGTINTHGRKETEELLQNMPIIAEKWIHYRDVVFEELDLEMILKQKPSIVLVDELAHTNVPGARHAKRWQDVVEILDAGIDVYTTLNVQHLESRKDLVESITGIQIRETVPDSILERASTIELIDISPLELLQRLKEGKVYLGLQSQIAAKNFFREDTLMALREIALRFTAEKVDHDLHTILSPGKSWKTREKLLVAINTNPYCQQLIRITRRRAFELDAPWTAVYVDTGQTLNEDEKAQLTAHVNLAQELGGDVVLTKDDDIASALQRIARQKNSTQLVIGRPSRHPFFDYFQKSLIDKLEEQNKHLDLLIVREDRAPKSFPAFHLQSRLLKSSIADYIRALIAVLAMTIVCYFATIFVVYKAIGFIYLIGIVLLSLYLGTGPILFSALLSTLAWYAFFTPPILATSTSAGTEMVLTLIFFCTAAVMGLLVGKISKQEIFLKNRERKLENLYEIERDIASSQDEQTLKKNICSRLQSLFNGFFDLIIQRGSSSVDFHGSLDALQDEKEQAVALWVLENGKLAGKFTSTLPSSQGLYLPLQIGFRTIGVLVYISKEERSLSIEELTFLQNVAKQISHHLEKTEAEDRISVHSFTEQMEQMQKTLLQSVANTLIAPLKEIELSASTLEPINTINNSAIENIKKSCKRMNRLAANALSSSAIDSGFMHLKKERLVMRPFLQQAIESLEDHLDEHLVHLSCDDLIEITLDPNLIKLLLENLAFELVRHAEPKATLELVFEPQTQGWTLKFSAFCKPGAEKILNETLNSKRKGLSQASISHGISLAKSIVNIHEGSLSLSTSSDGMLSFACTFNSSIYTNSTPAVST